MPGSVDRAPDFVREWRAMKARVADLQASTNRLAAVTKVSGGSATVASGGSATAISFANVDVDTTGAFDAGTPNRLTATRAGIYMAVGSGIFNANGTGVRALSVSSNNTLADTYGAQLTASSVDGWAMAPCGMLVLDEGDIVQLKAFQNRGGSLGFSFGVLAIAWLGFNHRAV